jgi:hypothetical protein
LEYFGQTPPGKTPIQFAQNIIGNWEHGEVTFSPDGLEAYWSNRSYIITSKVENGRWTTPSIASFSGHGNPQGSVPYDDNPVISPDNSKLFFTSFRPIGYSTPNKEHIWYVERTPTGWGEPIPLPQNVNSVPPYLHWQISITIDNTVYFGANTKIYFTRLVNGNYSDPEEVSIANDLGLVTIPFIAPDESYLIFTKVVDGRPSNYISFKDNKGQWLTPQSISQISGTIFVSRDGKYIFSWFQWISAEILEDYKPAALLPVMMMKSSTYPSDLATVSSASV